MWKTNKNPLKILQLHTQANQADANSGNQDRFLLLGQKADKLKIHSLREREHFIHICYEMCFWKLLDAPFAFRPDPLTGLLQLRLSPVLV